MMKGSIREFDGKRPFLVCLFVRLVDAVQGGSMLVIIVGDVQGSAGTSADQNGEKQNGQPCPAVLSWNM
jgi:hypothetical protein